MHKLLNWKADSVIFPRSWPENGNICALGCVLDEAQDTVWGHQLESPCLEEALAEEGASGRCPRRQGAQARQRAKEGPEAWALGVLSISCVC